MKKLTTATDLGGAPIYKSDFRTLFNVDIWDCVQGLLSMYNATTEGVIVSGCVVTPNAGNFDMTTGVVYLNGVFMRVPAVTNQTFPKYIQPGTVVNDSRIFADGSTHTVMVDTPAICQAGIPGSGQYITISTTGNLGQMGGGRIETYITTGVIKIYYKTTGGGFAETAFTMPRTANRTTRYSIEMVSTFISGGSDPAGSGSSQYYVRAVKDLAGTGTMLTATVLENQQTIASAPVLLIALSGTNTLIQVNAASTSSLYGCLITIRTMEI